MESLRPFASNGGEQAREVVDMRFPARRFFWISPDRMPEVGPLIGIDQGPFHAQLLGKLAEKHGERVYEARAFAGWLEFSNGRYRLADPADGFCYEDLPARDRRLLIDSLRRWAAREGATVVVD